MQLHDLNCPHDPSDHCCDDHWVSAPSAFKRLRESQPEETEVIQTFDPVASPMTRSPTPSPVPTEIPDLDEEEVNSLP